MILGQQLGVSTAMVLATTLVHLGGLAALLPLLRFSVRRAMPRRILRQMAAIVLAAIGLIALHGAEIWAYAWLFDAVGAVEDFETALYFSTATYTTVGYGDVLLARPWRLVGAIEGANGIILLGWSTAFFVAIVSRIGIVEREIER